MRGLSLSNAPPRCFAGTIRIGLLARFLDAFGSWLDVGARTTRAVRRFHSTLSMMVLTLRPESREREREPLDTAQRAARLCVARESSKEWRCLWVGISPPKNAQDPGRIGRCVWGQHTRRFRHRRTRRATAPATASRTLPASVRKFRWILEAVATRSDFEPAWVRNACEVRCRGISELRPKCVPIMVENRAVTNVGAVSSRERGRARAPIWKDHRRCCEERKKQPRTPRATTRPSSSRAPSYRSRVSGRTSVTTARLDQPVETKTNGILERRNVLLG